MERNRISGSRVKAVTRFFFLIVVLLAFALQGAGQAEAAFSAHDGVQMSAVMDKSVSGENCAIPLHTGCHLSSTVAEAQWVWGAALFLSGDAHAQRTADQDVRGQRNPPPLGHPPKG